MSSDKMRYTLVLVKDGMESESWQKNLSEVAHQVDIVWSDVCTVDEAFDQFRALIKRQIYEYRQLKTIDKWRVIRLYDTNGEQIAQES